MCIILCGIYHSVMSHRYLLGTEVSFIYVLHYMWDINESCHIYTFLESRCLVCVLIIICIMSRSDVKLIPPWGGGVLCMYCTRCIMSHVTHNMTHMYCTRCIISMSHVTCIISMSHVTCIISMSHVTCIISMSHVTSIPAWEGGFLYVYCIICFISMNLVICIPPWEGGVLYLYCVRCIISLSHVTCIISLSHVTSVLAWAGGV